LRRAFIVLTAVMLIMASTVSGVAAKAQRSIGINVALNQDATDAVLADIGRYGRVLDVYENLDALTMKVREADLATIQALPYVAAANPDAKRVGKPVPSAPVGDFSAGISTWNQDAINATDFEAGHVLPYDGDGVYVAVLDTGLLSSWRYYFGEERIASEFGVAFGGGGGERGSISNQPSKWQLDQNSHGTHVTSTIIGYNLGGTPVAGVAPMAKIIPVKVLNQNGSGWSSVIARGITYIADLKNSGALGGAPVVINMSLGGSVLDAVEKAAVDYAVQSGVIIVASAGNAGNAGMGFPGAYAPVISVAAAGWNGQWAPAGNNGWWNNRDVPESAGAEHFHIATFSSRQKAGQDLDVVAPGSWIVGPYQVNSGKTSYFYLSGTSMSAPHVAGIAALMMQKNPSLTQGMVETLLEGAAKPMAAGCVNVLVPGGATQNVCWGADAVGAGFITADSALAVTP
jgi:subtilisin family serine protease